MIDKKDDEMDKLIDELVLDSFQIETVIDLLIEKEIFTSQEFKDKIFLKIDRGGDEESKIRLKQRIGKHY